MRLTLNFKSKQQSQSKGLSIFQETNQVSINFVLPSYSTTQAYRPVRPPSASPLASSIPPSGRPASVTTDSGFEDFCMVLFCLAVREEKGRPNNYQRPFEFTSPWFCDAQEGTKLWWIRGQADNLGSALERYALHPSFHYPGRVFK